MTDALEELLDDLVEVDLTRYVRTKAGAKWYHLPIGSPIGEGHGGGEELHETPLDEIDFDDDTSFGKALGMDPKEFANYPESSKDAIFSELAKAQGPDGKMFPDDPPGTLTSIGVQTHAQIKAENWFGADNFGGGSYYNDGKSPAQQIWSDYQNPYTYGDINATLRQGSDRPWSDSEKYRSYTATKRAADEAFQEAGVKLTKPMSVYRAYKSNDQDAPVNKDWSKEFYPGATFKDDGIVSTTAMPKMGSGWLSVSHDGTPRQPKSNDVVVEMRLPKGMTVLGGNTEFIETMLPPGTKFKVISAEKKTRQPAISPLGGQPFLNTYTHVIAEVQP